MVSVIIPVYNVENYIVRCLRSVVKQELVKDIECIIVDDCGTDNSMKLVLDFVDQYTGSVRFRIIHHKVNKGLSAARNTGVRAVSEFSEWIYFLDSDDEIKSDCLQTLLLLAARYPQSEILCGNTLTLPNIGDDAWRNISAKKGLPLYIENNRIANRYFFDVNNIHDWIPVNAWNKLIRTSFIKSHNITFCEGLIHEDELWMFDVMKHVEHIAFTKTRTYVHYQNDGSITRSGQEKKSCLHRVAIARWEMSNLTEEYRAMQIRKIFFQLADVYERSLPIDRQFRKGIEAAIQEVADTAGVKVPRAFKIWYLLPKHTAHCLAPYFRKILIS